jgi:hypothetical protein
MNELQSVALQALSAVLVLSGFEFEDNFNTLAPMIRAMLDHERWQLRLVELLLCPAPLSCSPSPSISGVTRRLLSWSDLADQPHCIALRCVCVCHVLWVVGVVVVCVCVCMYVMFSVHREGGLLVLQSLLADKEELFNALNGDDGGTFPPNARMCW